MFIGLQFCSIKVIVTDILLSR